MWHRTGGRAASARRPFSTVLTPAGALVGLGFALAGVGQAGALEFLADFDQSAPFGTCTAHAYYDKVEVAPFDFEERYEVVLRVGGAIVAAPEGSYLFVKQGEPSIQSADAITPELLASQCGITGAVITESTGIDYSYWEASYYGITFTGTYEGQSYSFWVYMNGAGGFVGSQALAPSGPDPDDIVDAIAQSQQHNAARLLAAQPDLARTVFSTLPGSGPDLWLTPGSAGIGQDGQFWFKLSSTFDLEGKTEPYLFGVVGGHVMPTSDLALGAMLQFDSSETADLETKGWLAGPYLVARLPGGGVVAEARLLYGNTSSTGDILDLAGDDLTGNRLLAHAALSGRVQAGVVVFTPRIEGGYVLARSDAYTTDTDADVPGVETTLARLRASLDGDIDLVHIGLAGVSLGGGVSGSWSHARSNEGVPAEAFSFGTALRLGFAPSEAVRLSVGLDLDDLGTDAATAKLSAGLGGGF